MWCKFLQDIYLEYFVIFGATVSDKINLPYSERRPFLLPFPLCNVAVLLSRTLTYMLTHNIDLGDGGREKVALPN